MGLESVSTSEDVIGDLPWPCAIIHSENWWQSRTKGKKVGALAGSVFSLVVSRCVYNIRPKQGEIN